MTEQLAILGGSGCVTIRHEFQWPITSEEEIAEVSELMRQGGTSDTGYSEPIRRWAA
jgi:hypothetical protein